MSNEIKISGDGKETRRGGRPRPPGRAKLYKRRKARTCGPGAHEDVRPYACNFGIDYAFPPDALSISSSAFLRSILGSIRAGVVVVDRELVVQLWSRRAEGLWGLRSDEAVGKHLLKLGLGLPAEGLKGAIRSCVAGESEYVEIVVPLTNHRGRTIRRRVTCTPIGRPDGQAGAILLFEKENP